jgi:hypothetical protein
MAAVTGRSRPNRRGVPCEVLFCRLPVSLKMQLEEVCDTYGVSMAYAVSRAIECYLIDRIGAEGPATREPLP